MEFLHPYKCNAIACKNMPNLIVHCIKEKFSFHNPDNHNYNIRYVCDDHDNQNGYKYGHSWRVIARIGLDLEPVLQSIDEWNAAQEYVEIHNHGAWNDIFHVPVQPDEFSIKLANGNSIICESFEDNDAGTSFVRVIDSTGHELGFWNSSEWQEDPELVMGAIFGCAGES